MLSLLVSITIAYEGLVGFSVTCVYEGLVGFGAHVYQLSGCAVEGSNVKTTPP